jgi:galactan 5-O-arabinofuranosyltransferase
MTALTVRPSDPSGDEQSPTNFSTSLPDVTRLVRFAGELALATVAAVVTSLTMQLLVGVVQVPVSSLVPVALSTFGAFLLIGVLFALVLCDLRGRRSSMAIPLTWVALSALATMPLSLMLLGTKHYIFGISGDQSFRVQYLTRFAHSARLTDIAYADLPPYYPAGWFWIGGRVADLAGVPGWEAYKPYAIATMALAGIVAFCVWSLVVRRPQATLLALITVAIGLRLAAYQPYSWLLAAALPPLAVLALRIVRAAATGAPTRRWLASTVLVGLALGAAGAIYTLLFWFFGLLLVLLAIAALLLNQPGHRLIAARRLAIPPVIIGVVALPIVLLVWAPYIAELLQRGFQRGAAQRFLPDSSAVWPLPMVEPSATGALALIGTIWLFMRLRNSDVSQALGIMTLAIYGWYALSALALAAGTTLLAFRLEPLLVATLACAGVFGLLDGTRAALHWFTEDNLQHRHPVPFRGIVIALSFAALLGMVQTVPQEYEWSEAAQFGDYYPTGVTPTGTSDNSDAGAWNDELIATINELTDTPPSELVVLSIHYKLFAYRPYFAFQTTIAQYANPLADFPGRRAEIESWAASTTSAQLLKALDAAPARPPSVFILRRQPDGLHLRVTYDTFPAQPNVGSRRVVFEPDLFDDAAFQRRDVGPFAVIVRDTAATNPPLSGTETD